MKVGVIVGCTVGTDVDGDIEGGWVGEFEGNVDGELNINKIWNRNSCLSIYSTLTLLVLCELNFCKSLFKACSYGILAETQKFTLAKTFSIQVN